MNNSIFPRNFTLIFNKFIPLLSLLLAISSASAAESARTQADPVLRALQTEMDRSKAKLRLENSPAPYFIGYRIVDIDTWEADAALGGVREESRTRIRFLMV